MMMAANPQAQTDDYENQRHNLKRESYAQGGRAQEGSRWGKTEIGNTQIRNRKY
jgi:hypothetical protein